MANLAAVMRSALMPAAAARSTTSAKSVSGLGTVLLRSLGLTDYEGWRAVLGGTSAAGKSVTVDSAMQLATVFACIRLIAETIATLPAGIYEKLTDGSSRAVTGHELYSLIRTQPNADQTAVEFWEEMLLALLTDGNGFAEIKRLGKRVVALIPIDPHRVRVFRRDNGMRAYEVQPESGPLRQVAAADMFHVRGFGRGLRGLSPISYARESMGAAIAADESSAKVFASHMRASGFLKSDNLLKSDQREQIRGSLESFVGNRNAGRLMVLEAGLTYQKLDISPADAQLLTTRSFNIEELCRWFKVPPIMIGHASQGQTMWGSGVEQLILQFLTMSLTPWLKRIESRINRDLMSPGDRERYYAKFSVEGLLRGDSAARAAYLSTMVNNGLMTRNEARAYDDRGALPGGDVLTVQSALVPLEQIGTTTNEQAARAALLAWLRPEDDNHVPQSAPASVAAPVAAAA